MKQNNAPLTLKNVYGKIIDEVWTHFDYYDPPRENVVRKCIEGGCDAFLHRVSEGDNYEEAMEVAKKIIAIYAEDVSI